MADEFVTIKGLKELKYKLQNADEMTAGPWKRAMTEIADAGYAAILNSAPQRTGRLKSKIFVKVQQKPFPLWVAIRARGVAKWDKKNLRKSRSRNRYPRGFPYPRLLEFSPKHGHAGWFYKRIAPAVQSKADSALATAGREIAEKWGK